MAANDQQKAIGPSVPLRERYLVYPGAPLPDFATSTAQAFHAEDRRDPKRQFFAVVARPGFPTRTNVMRALKGVDNPGLMTMVEWGVMDWPPANRKVMAVIYEKPLGGRVMANMTSEFRPIPEADMVKKVITPMTEALKKLRALSLTHRAIRPTNMYWATAERDRIVLGDCVTTPPAFEQPAIVEPLDSGQCNPAGRGAGTYTDDSYALGASLVMLLQGRNLVAKQDDAVVIRNKMINGSYSALVGDARMPVQMIEVLRGLLCDDAAQRWHVEGLELWLAGRRMSPLISKNEKRASRAFNFGGKDHTTARELSVAFSKNFDAAAQAVLDGRLELWLRRSLDQADKATAVSDAMHSAVAIAADKKPAFDYMVSKVCMILDSTAPIRYKGLNFLPDGLGALLAVTVVEGGDIKLIAEAILRSITKSWVETRESYNPENSMMESAFNTQKVFLERTTIGNGVERLVYEMNDSMPCLSSHVVDEYVIDIRDLLPALNNAARKNEGKGWPVERHIAAFIAARATFDVERAIYELSEGNPARAALAMLNILAVMQWRLGQGGMTSLAGWVAGLMGPAVNSYYNRETRKQIEKELPRIAKEGNLVEMARVLDNPEARALDQQGYEQARHDYAVMAQDIRNIEAGQIGTDDEGVKTAQQIASLISVTIAFITTTLLLISRFFNG